MLAAAVGVLFASGRVITWWCVSLLATIIALLLLFLRVKKEEPQKGRSSEHKPINNRKKRKKRKKRVKQRTNRHERKTCDTKVDSGGATCSVPHAANCTRRRLNSVKEEGQLQWQKRKERFVKQRELKERRRIERKERLREEREQKENEQREQKARIKEAKIRQRERKQKEQGKQTKKKTEEGNTIAPASVANLLNLPHEILLFIFGSLSIVDLCTICQAIAPLLLSGLCWLCAISFVCLFDAHR